MCASGPVAQCGFTQPLHNVSLSLAVQSIATPPAAHLVGSGSSLYTSVLSARHWMRSTASGRCCSRAWNDSLNSPAGRSTSRSSSSARGGKMADSDVHWFVMCPHFVHAHPLERRQQWHLLAFDLRC